MSQPFSPDISAEWLKVIPFDRLPEGIKVRGQRRPANSHLASPAIRPVIETALESISFTNPVSQLAALAVNDSMIPAPVPLWEQ